MAILWFGGEDIDFKNGVAVSVSTNTERFRTDYSRCAVCGGVQNGITKGTVFPGGAVTSAWLSCQLYTSSVSSQKDIGFGKSGTNSGLFIANNGNQIQLIKYNGSTSTTLATESGHSFSGLLKVDMQVIDYGATATVNIYASGVLALTYTGNVAVSGMTNFDSVYLTRDIIAIHASEIIVADEDTRTMSLRTRYPTADGTTHDMTGAYSDVDEVTINDADVIYTNTADKDQQCEISDLPAGTFAVLATKIAVRACKSEDASIDKIKLGYLSDGNVAVGSTKSLTTSMVTYEDLFATNPVSLSAWLQSEQNALQVNVRSSA